MRESESYSEEVGDISLTLIKYRGLPGTRRWDGTAWAYWGGLTSSSDRRSWHRSRRAARKNLIRKLNWYRGNLGSDTDRTVRDATNGFLDFRGRELTRIDLHGFDLRRSNFSNTNLLKADLTGAILRGSNFTCANVANANLTQVDLSKAILTGAAFHGSNLSGSVFRNSSHQGKLNAPPHDTRIRMESWVGWLYFVECDLSDCVFDGAKLPGVFFKRCDLSRATFRGTDLEGARILDCELDGAIFEDARMLGAHVGTPRDDEPDDQWF